MRAKLKLAIVAVLVECVAAQTSSKPEGAFSVVAFCSRTRPGVPIAKLVWKVPHQPGESAPSVQFVDVTTDKMGFERNQFVTIWPQKSEHNPAIGSAANGGRQLDPVRSLRLTPSGEAKFMAGRFVLQPEGLEAGVNYFWRLRTKTAQGWKNVVVETVGPVCPVDSQR
jgi:hypothetical protein